MKTPAEALSLALLLAFAGCGVTDVDPALPLRNDCPSSAPARSVSSAAIASLPPFFSPGNPNYEWAEVARRAPGGWGGNYVRGVEAVILLVEPARVHAAVPVLRDAGIWVPDGVTVEPARWDFAQLFDWNRYVTGRMGPRWVDGVNAVGIDQRSNRIRYGVVDDAARVRLEAFLTTLDLPCGLVRIDVVGIGYPL